MIKIAAFAFGGFAVLLFALMASAAEMISTLPGPWS